MKVLVTGASGYVGTRVSARLERDGHTVVPFSRKTGGDITRYDDVTRAMAGADAVVHLIAILDGTDEQFQSINVGGTQNVLAAAEDAGVKRFLHMSALGVDAEHAGLTRYYRTKFDALNAVTGSALDWTVFKPSFIFGAGGGALKAFESLVRGPVAPVIGNGRYRHQPVWVEDVATAFSAALERPQTVGKTLRAGRAAAARVQPPAGRARPGYGPLTAAQGARPRRAHEGPDGGAEALPAAAQGHPRADRHAAGRDPVRHRPGAARSGRRARLDCRGLQPPVEFLASIGGRC